MPLCTPQEDNLLFPRRGFQGPAHAHFRAGNSVWISTPPALVSKLPIGPICLTRGKPEFLRFTRKTGRYLVGPTVEVRGSVDRSTGNFAKAKPSRAAHRTCSQPVGERETTRKSPLPAEYRFRPRVARRLRIASDSVISSPQPTSRVVASLVIAWQSGTTRVRSSSQQGLRVLVLQHFTNTEPF